LIVTQFNFVAPQTAQSVYNFTFLPLMCVNGTIGSICTEGFTAVSAQLACGTAGFFLGLRVMGKSKWYTKF